MAVSTWPSGARSSKEPGRGGSPGPRVWRAERGAFTSNSVQPRSFPLPQRAQTVSSVPWFRLSPLLAGCERVEAPAAHGARVDVRSAPSLVRGARCGNRRAFCRAAQRGCSALTYSVAGVAEARTS